MKKQNIILILVPIILILILSLGIYIYSNNKAYNIKEDNKLWHIYDMNISKIENIMSQISEPNEAFEWWTLKEFDIEDNEYESTLNNLLSDIRMKYIELTDENVMYTDSNPLRKYKDKETISKKELEVSIWKINNANNFKFHFKKYQEIVLSQNEQNSKIFLDKMNELEELQNKYFKSEPKTYNDLLYNEIIETSILVDLSEFLKSEYIRLTN